MVNPLDIPKNLVGTGFRIASSVVSTAAKPVGAIVGRVIGSRHDDSASATAQPASPTATTPQPAPPRKTGTTGSTRATLTDKPSRAGATSPTAPDNGPKPEGPKPERTPAELAATGEGRQPAPFGSHEPETAS